MPNALDLPSTFFPNSRGLLLGRAVSVYRGHHAPTHWLEHWHLQLEIVLHLDPAPCHLRWKDSTGTWQQKAIREPSIWILRAGIRHEVVLEGSGDIVTIYVDTRLADQIAVIPLPESICVPLGQLGSRDVLLLQLAIALRQICRDNDTSSALYIESIGTVVAEHVLRGLSQAPGKPNRCGGLSAEALQKVTRYIDIHLAHHLDSATLARLLGYSRSQFIRLFKRSLGLTPREYVMHRRTVKAEELLIKTDEKLTVVAEKCGFSDDTHLARWLRRIRGLRPGELRRNARKRQHPSSP